MTALAVIIGAVIAALCVVFVAGPFLREPALAGAADLIDVDSAVDDRVIDLVEQRDRALAALKELEFDHRTGKISDDDYRAQVGPLRREAAEALRGLEPPAPAAPGPASAAAAPAAPETTA